MLCIDVQVSDTPVDIVEIYVVGVADVAIHGVDPHAHCLVNPLQRGAHLLVLPVSPDDARAIGDQAQVTRRHGSGVDHGIFAAITAPRARLVEVTEAVITKRPALSSCSYFMALQLAGVQRRRSARCRVRRSLVQPSVGRSCRPRPPASSAVVCNPNPDSIGFCSVVS